MGRGKRRGSSSSVAIGVASATAGQSVCDKEIWQQTNKEYVGEYEEGDDQSRRARLDAHLEREHTWGAAMARAISLNLITPSKAREMGFYSGLYGPSNTSRQGTDLGWEKLPDQLFHVTTAKSAVLDEGLKTRRELNQGRGLGLGGGTSDAISFTDSYEVAEAIEDGLREMQQVARGEITVSDMLEQAKNGTGAERPFYLDFIQYYARDAKPGDPLPMGLVDLIAGCERNSRGWLMTVEEAHEKLGPEWYLDSEAKPIEVPKGTSYDQHSFIRDLSQAEIAERTVDVYKIFATWREQAGGRLDPLFFLSDTEALAKLPEEEIAIVSCAPACEGARGWRADALGEWRVSTGEAAKVVA